MSCQKNCYNKIKSKISCPDNTRNNTPMVFNNQTDVYSNNKPRNISKNAKEVTNGRGIYWGDTEEFCKSLVEPISVKIRYTESIEKGKPYRIMDKSKIKTKKINIEVNKAISKKVQDIFEEIYNDNDTEVYKDYGYFVFCGDIHNYCYRCAKNSDGSCKKDEHNKYDKLSYHSYGAALDFCNQYANSYGKLVYNQNTELHIANKNHPVVKIFEKHGFGWGGSYDDYMHFSYLGGR